MVNKLLRKFGLQITRTEDSRGYALHRDCANGQFDYARYRAVQEAGNKAKLDQVWALEPNIKFLADYVREKLGPPAFGICHGTRRGKEQAWFRKYLGCEVIGTEISETATQFPNTIQWDFHEVKPEWLDAVDFIYSNSFDHSHSPEACLNAWMRCVRPGGLCIIEHSSMHEPSAVNELDPFGATLVAMPYLATTWGGGRYGVREILTAPVRAEAAVSYLAFVVVQRW